METASSSRTKPSLAPLERLSGVKVTRDRELQAGVSPLPMQQIILFWDMPQRSKN